MKNFLSFLKDYFIESKNNKHSHFFLKKKTLFQIFILVSVLELVFVLAILNIIPFAKFLGSIMPDVLVDLSNNYREENYLNVLIVSPLLQEAAGLKAEDMASKGYFAHTSPEGIDPWHWFDKVGYNFIYAGENLAINFLDSNLLHQAWLNSSKHRANIVNQNFTEIGIATVRGLYKGKEAIFVVQMFGAPREEFLSYAGFKNTESTQNAEPSPEVRPAEIIAVSEEGQQKVVAGEIIKDENSARIIIGEEETFFSAMKINEDFVSKKNIRYSSFFARIFSSPKTAINYLLFSLSFIIGFCLLLKIIGKNRFKFPKLILNGFIVLFIIVGALYFNHWLISIFGIIP